MLDRELHKRIVDILMRTPFTANIDGRDVLLAGVPSNIINSLNRNPQQRIDLHKIIDQLDNLGRLEGTDTSLLIIFLKNAQQSVAGTNTGRDLELIIQEIEKPDQKETILIQEHREALIYGGSEERLDYDFFRRAIEVPRSITRLKVPRFFGTRRDRSVGYGTGWLITPELLFTNYHVIEARNLDRGEQQATIEECYKQVLNMQVWFDYVDAESSHVECSCQELVYWNQTLDYALIRLDCASLAESRPPLQLAQPQQLNREDRLNIVQYANGYPLKFAIRNNFFIGSNPIRSYIYYMTDTENGSSGAPVCNDHWQVVGMHCKTGQVSPETWKGETIRYHNIGVEIYSILNDLPPYVQQEIAEAQERA